MAKKKVKKSAKTVKKVAYNNRFLALENDGNGKDTMTAVPLRSVKKGDYFKLQPTDTAPVWVKDDYDRSDKKYWAYKYDDSNSCRQFSGSKIVYTDFWF